MRIRPDRGLTFDDVLLVPRRSPFASRADVDTASRLTNDITLAVPILSANMDTVTEAKMAIAMARNGGIGILHRFMSIEAQAELVRRVKRAEGFMVQDPFSISHDAPIGEAERLMNAQGVGGLMVTDGDSRLVGLITQRDILLAPATVTVVSEAMTLPDKIISVAPEVTVEEARRILYEHRVEKLPVLDSEGNLVGLITAQDVISAEKYPLATKDSRGRLRVGAAIGVKKRDIDRAGALLDAGADVLVLDIAHGHADHCLDMLRKLRDLYPAASVIAGNVATRQGARDLVEAGAAGVKVGIGPGSICTTRIVAGYGVPQLTAIIDSAQGVVESGRHVPIIADGGIRRSGDMVKALAAGADTVMIGSLFAGCEEAPGSPVIRDGQKVKVVRGMASLGAAMTRREAERGEDESAEDQEDWDKVVPEGVEAVVPYRGHLHEILHQLIGGLRSGLSYGGAQSIKELQECAEFIEIGLAGVRESYWHDVRRL